jgi:hypothetical protein
VTEAKKRRRELERRQKRKITALKLREYSLPPAATNPGQGNVSLYRDADTSDPMHSGWKGVPSRPKNKLKRG